jgi:hypothetical protein
MLMPFSNYARAVCLAFQPTIRQALPTAFLKQNGWSVRFILNVGQFSVLLCLLLLPARLALAADDPLCAALVSRVAAVPGDGPLFLRSYETADGVVLADPALANTAFTYDNALAVIALLACEQPAAARRVGAALERAVNRDRHWRDGRMRNAYRAGPVEGDPLPPGWWDKAQGRWSEDAYQVGSGTGNIAWAALALLNLAESSGESRWRSAAARTLSWVVDSARRNAIAGRPLQFRGGSHGHEPHPQELTWVATEHAVDLAAAFAWLAARPAPPAPGDVLDWNVPASAARQFVERMWQPSEGRFLIGLTPDGTQNRDGSGLDAQLWPLLAISNPPADWQRSLIHVAARYAADGGFDFNEDRDGMWVEGTAQAALTFHAVGNRAESQRLLTEIGREISPGGLLFATRSARLTTGLAIGPDSRSADFFYYRHGHLGATAWAILAARRWNPFTGKILD